MSKHERTYSVSLTIGVQLKLTVQGRGRTALREAHERAIKALAADGFNETVTSFGDAHLIKDEVSCGLCGYVIFPEAPLTAMNGRKRIKVCQECWDQLIQEQ